jgi:predicted alpha-1,6-mannanase (GH76 family)
MSLACSLLARKVGRCALALVLLGCGSESKGQNGAAGAGSGAAPGSGNGGLGNGGMAPVAGAGGSAGSSTQGGDSAMGGSGAGMAGGGAAGGPSEPLFPPLIEGCDIPTAHQRADAGLDSLLLHFWSDEEQYLYATSNAGSVTGYWTYAQGFDALLDGVERTGGQKYSEWIRRFYDGRDERGWLVDYFDDESWMTLALLRAYDLTDEQLYLDQAIALYQDIMAAWDTTCCGQHLGGIWWNRQHQQKATASNAGPVIAGVRLTERTNDPQYQAFARQAYDFWWEHMVNQETFAIYDHLNPDGTRAPGSLTYNHGVMISAALELHAATGEAHFLEEAHGFGEYLVSVATRDSDVGPLLHDAIGQSCDGDCPAWKGIGYRYLAKLYRQDPTRAEYREVLTAGAEGIWTLARNPENDFFATNWAGPAPTVGGIEEQGSAVMALNIYAMLCGSLTQPLP